MVSLKTYFSQLMIDCNVYLANYIAERSRCFQGLQGQNTKQQKPLPGRLSNMTHYAPLLWLPGELLEPRKDFGLLVLVEGSFQGGDVTKSAEIQNNKELWLVLIVT